MEVRTKMLKNGVSSLRAGEFFGVEDHMWISGGEITYGERGGFQ